MKTRLVNYREGEIDMVFMLDRPRTTIGRESDNMIQLPNERVSKHHAAIHLVDGAWSIEDLGSRNGVLLNGVRITKSPLKDRDQIQIGPHEFYFEVNVPSEDFVPSYIVDLSPGTRDRTMTGVVPPKTS